LLEHDGNTVTGGHVNKAIQRLIAEKDAKGAKEVLEQLDTWNINGSIRFYTVLLQALLENEYFLLEEVKEIHKIVISSFKPDLFYYTTIVKIYSQNGIFDAVDEVLEEMQSYHDIHPDSIFYDVLINGYVLHNKIHKASIILEESMARGKCNALSFAPLLAHFSGLGDTEMCMKLFNAMKQLNIPLNIDLFHRILHEIKGDAEKIRELLNIMDQNNIKPSVFFYNGLLEIYAHKRDLTSATRTIEEMSSKGISPNLSSFNMILTAYSYSGDYVNFGKLVETMVSRGIQPDIRSMNLFMKLFVVRKEYSKAEEIYVKSVKDKYVPDKYTLIYAFEALGSLQKIDDIQLEMAEIKLTRSSLLTTKLYTAYLAAMAKCRAWKETEQELRYMISSKQMQPDLITFTQLLGIALKQYNFEAFDIIVDLHKKTLGNSIVDSRFNFLIKKREGKRIKKKLPQRVFKRLNNT